MPSSRQRATSSGWPAEVSITISVRADPGPRRMRSARVKPSMPGMWASSSTSGNGFAAAAACPRAASAASPPSTASGRIPQLPQHLFEDAAVGGVVIDHEHRQVVQPFRLRRRRPGHRAVRQAEAGREVEGAALADRALDPDPAAHHLHQLRGDGQAQAGAAVLARGGGVGLGEGLEDQPLLFGRDADAGVAHLEMQKWRVRECASGERPPASVAANVAFTRHSNGDDDLAVLGELQGVARQVDDDLAQAGRGRPPDRRERPGRCGRPAPGRAPPPAPPAP